MATSVAASLRRLPLPLAAAASFSTTPPAIPTITPPTTNPAEEQLVNVEINGRQVAVPAYSTILEAARAAGAFVPTLCAHPSIPARATCRICLVELETDQGMKKVVGPASATDARRVEKLVPITKLVPACVTQVKPGQRIHTHSPDVLENVRFVLQLLRAKHPNTCQTCDANGQCTFQDLLYRYQVCGGGEDVLLLSSFCECLRAFFLL
jgi:NADH-quinone oxidoreductase subunit G